MDSSPCDENAECTNNDGSYSCTCKEGFDGDGVTCKGMQVSYIYINYIYARQSACQSWQKKKKQKTQLSDYFFFEYH